MSELHDDGILNLALEYVLVIVLIALEAIERLAERWARS